MLSVRHGRTGDRSCHGCAGGNLARRSGPAGARAARNRQRTCRRPRQCRAGAASDDWPGGHGHSGAGVRTGACAGIRASFSGCFRRQRFSACCLARDVCSRCRRCACGGGSSRATGWRAKHFVGVRISRRVRRLGIRLAAARRSRFAGRFFRTGRAVGRFPVSRAIGALQAFRARGGVSGPARFGHGGA